MGTTEIILLLLGLAVFIASFVIPEKKTLGKADLKQEEKRIKEITEKEIKNMQEKLSGAAEETAGNAIDKAERSMERLANEKIMAVNEYSDTVLKEINRNHEEVVFLYDMLNDKHTALTNTASEVEKTAKEAKQTVKDAGLIVKDMETAVKEQQEAVNKAEELRKAEAESHRQDELRKNEENLRRQKELSDWEEELKKVKDEILRLDELKKNEEAINKRKDTKKAVKDSQDQVKSELPETVPEAETEADKTEIPNKPAAKKSPAKRKTPAKTRKTKKEESSDVSIQFTETGRGSNNNDKILALHKEGRSNMAIAKELGLGIGEVKLVIDLFEGL